MSKASIASIANTVFLICLILLVQLGFLEFYPPLSYTAHKLLHIIGACMFIGNIFVGPVWVMFAIRSEKLELLQFSFKILLLTDILVTIPGIDLTVINGLFLGQAMGGVNEIYWLKHAIWDLFALWVLVYPILRIQDRMKLLVENGEFDSVTFRRKLRQWMIVGALSLVPVGHILYLMVYKP